MCINPCTPKSAKDNSFNILKNKQYNAKVLLKRFHLNGRTMGFCPHTKKLEQHYISL